MLNEDDELKIEQIYGEHRMLLLNVAYSVTEDRHSAEDAVQEAVVKILRHPGKISELEGSELKNYIAAIVKHTAVDFMRKANKINNKTVPLDPLVQGNVSDDFNPEDFVIDKITKDILKAEISNLKASYRDPLIFCKLYGYSVPEVSELLDTPERTVSHRIKTAIKTLKKSILKRTDCHE